MNTQKYIKIIKNTIPKISNEEAMEILDKTNWENDTEAEVLEQLKSILKDIKKKRK